MSERQPLPTAPFGRTGHVSTRVIFGAAALARMDQDAADAALALAIDAGINHIDTAASYGASEVLLAPWLANHRHEVFLATKTGERTASAARAQLELSLTRMGVDSVDLVQLHNLVEVDEWETVHGPDGALGALVQARDEGLCRHIGVTGHGTRIAGMHLRSLAEFEYDSVLLPYNPILLDDPAYRFDVEALLEVCARRDVAVQTIKAVARGRWSEVPPKRRSWYEPIADPDARANAVRFVLSNPQLFCNTTSDVTLLPHLFDVARGRLDRPTDEELRADIESQGITPLFDGAERERI